MKRISAKRVWFPSAVFATALTLGLSGSAYAGADGPTLCNPTSGSCGWFTQNGDVIHVGDQACDGHAAVVQVSDVADDIHENIWNDAGCNTIVTYSYGTRIGEGHSVYYRPCLGQHIAGDPVTDCTEGWTHGTA
jgi:hypothetical protein